jgi:hypothetical protein
MKSMMPHGITELERVKYRGVRWARYVAKIHDVTRQCVIYIGRPLFRALHCRRLGWVGYVAVLDTTR